MLRRIAGKGPPTSEIATSNYVLSSAGFESRSTELTHLRLSAAVVTEKSGFRRERVLSLAFLLCVEHQMKSLSSRRKRELFQRLSSVNNMQWVRRTDKTVTGTGKTPILSITARIRQRTAPFITFHPKLHSKYKHGIEGAVIDFLTAYCDLLSESVGPSDFEYARSGLTSLLRHWGVVGLPKAGQRTPGLHWLVDWQAEHPDIGPDTLTAQLGFYLDDLLHRLFPLQIEIWNRKELQVLPEREAGEWLLAQLDQLGKSFDEFNLITSASADVVIREKMKKRRVSIADEMSLRYTHYSQIKEKEGMNEGAFKKLTPHIKQLIERMASTDDHEAKIILSIALQAGVWPSDVTILIDTTTGAIERPS